MTRMVQTGKEETHGVFWRGVVALCRGMTLLACLALVGMMVLVCADVAMRLMHRPLKGIYDIIRIMSVLTLACALPATTAMKGHVAIEYFFRKLNRTGRLVVDALMRLLMIGAFLLTAVACVGYGMRFLRNGRVTDTIEIPLFWVPWVMAVSFGVTALVVTLQLMFPGRRLMRT